MKKVIGIILAFSLMLIVVLASVGCSSISGNAPSKSPTPSATQVPYSGMVEDFVKNSSTFKFDGIEGSLKISKVVGSVNGDSEFTVEYQTRQPGHGDRSGKMLAQVITNHTAIVQVKDGKITSAICDGEWNMLTDSQIQGDNTNLALGEELILPVGQSLTVGGEDLTIKFVGVTGDSRAPRGVQAIWAGEAKIQLQITYRGSNFTKTLTEPGLTDGYTQDNFNQYEFAFRLLPYPEADKQPAAGDYELHMKVTNSIK